MRSLFCLELTLALALVALGGPARAETPVRVGVVVETAVNLSVDAQVDLSQRLGEALSQRLHVDVTAGREVARRLGGESLDPECYRNRACQKRVASLLQVEQLLVLVAVRLGTRLQVEPTWIDVATGRSVVRDAVVADSVKEDLSLVLAQAAPRLLPDAARRVPAPQLKATPTTLPPTVQVVTATVSAAPGLPTASWIAFGVAGAAVVVGAAVGLSASSDHGDLESQGCASMPCDLGRINAVDDKALAADLLFGTAGAAAVTGLVLWWLQDDTAPAVTTGPSASASGWSWTLRGRF